MINAKDAIGAMKKTREADKRAKEMGAPTIGKTYASDKLFHSKKVDMPKGDAYLAREQKVFKKQAMEKVQAHKGLK